MERLGQDLLAYLGGVSPAWAYAALAVSAFLENVIPPVPGDTVVVFSACLVGRGVLRWLPVYVATCAGGTAGFLLMYHLGRTRGRALLAGRRRAWLTPARLQRAEYWLSRYGPWLILANRFLSGVRSAIALAAGLGGMGWRPVALLGLVSMAVWNAALLSAGMLMGRNWEAVTGLLGQYNRAALAAAALAGLALLWHRRRRRGVDRSRWRT